MNPDETGMHGLLTELGALVNDWNATHDQIAQEIDLEDRKSVKHTMASGLIIRTMSGHLAQVVARYREEQVKRLLFGDEATQEGDAATPGSARTDDVQGVAAT